MVGHEHVPMDLPFDGRQQRQVARQWARTIEGRTELVGARHDDYRPVRPDVIDSWRRSMLSAIPADLPHAPMVLDDDALRVARERADWVPYALQAAQRLNGSFTEGHVLSLFDAEGRMLCVDGDAAVVEGLGAINFRPGGLWSELAVGTNGPGTALTLRRPVHIVGAEHFCQSWHDWHCAAVPLVDTLSGDVLGVVDISGFRSRAHPHTLELAKALVSSVQQMLVNRETERRYTLLHRFTELAVQYGQDAVIAVDRRGMVLHATPSTPAGLRPGTVTPQALRDSIAAHVQGVVAPGGARGSQQGARRDLLSEDVFLSLREDIGVTAVSYPVHDGKAVVGACLLLRGAASTRNTRNTRGAERQSDLPGNARAVTTTGEQRAAMWARTPATDRRTPAVGVRPAVTGTRYSFDDIIGGHARLESALEIASVAALNALPVLISGESGTGKEVFAQAIHRASDRQGQPFIAVNCAALPGELVEAELFGYVEGAFTGARREGSEGRFLAAHGGTIFLDEISELPPSAQASLLRVLQEQEVTAVGSSTSRAIDVRVIAATNRDVKQAVESGALRRDLYYRLNVLELALPPLRERLADVPALATHFLAAAAVEVGRPALTFAPAVLDALSRQDWPGNVRELRNVVRRMASMCVGTCITIGQLPTELLGSIRPSVHAPVGTSAVATAGAAQSGEKDLLRAHTLETLATSLSMSEAASRLGVNRSTLYRRLERYGVHPERSLRM
ncbi:MAG: sigma 54-interacting transcriptional regulator [Gemmatimonadota bacterium]